MDKAALRHEARARRVALSPSVRALGEELVTAAVQSTAAWQNARVVALYRSVGSELSSVGLINAAWKTGKEVVVPRVDGDALTWHTVLSWREMSPGAFGVPEPDKAAPVDPNEVALWIVPGLAFTVTGARLGQGKGFYDRALAGVSAPKWGLAFDEQIVEALPIEDHDVILDYVWFPGRMTQT